MDWETLIVELVMWIGFGVVLTYALDWLARQFGITGHIPPLPQGLELAKAHAEWKLHREPPHSASIRPKN